MGLTKPRAAQIFNLDYKQATRVVTTVSVSLSGGAPSSVDGVSLTTGDRVLVTAQGTGSQNGLYYVVTVGSGANGTWARTSDGNDNGEIEAGMIVMVTEGATYADTQWKLITDDPITIGTTALTFTQNYSANSISGGSSNVRVFSNANVTVSSAGTANVLTISSTGTVTSGTTSITGNVTGGNILTGGVISATGSINTDANIVAGTNTKTSPAIIYTNSANTQYGALLMQKVGVERWLIGSDNSTGNGNVVIRFNATTNYLTVTEAGAVIVGGNVTGGNILTAGIMSSTGNATHGNILTGGSISATGNVTGNYILGNVFYANGITASKIYNGTSEVNVSTSGGNANISIGGTSNVAVFSNTGAYFNGNLIPAVSNVYSLGTATNRWSNLYLTGNTIYLGNSIITENASGDLVINNTGSFAVPVGTTAQRSAVQGAIRYNTTAGAFETFDGVGWNTLAYGTQTDFPFGDYGSVSDAATTDAFGVSIAGTFDCNAEGPFSYNDLATGEAWVGA